MRCCKKHIKQSDMHDSTSNGGQLKKIIVSYKSKQELAAYIAVVKDEMNNIVNPPRMTAR